MQIDFSTATPAERMLAALNEADTAMAKLGWEPGLRPTPKGRANVHDHAVAIALHVLNARALDDQR